MGVLRPQAVLMAYRVKAPEEGMAWTQEPNMLHSPTVRSSWFVSTKPLGAANSKKRILKIMFSLYLFHSCTHSVFQWIYS